MFLVTKHFSALGNLSLKHVTMVTVKLNDGIIVNKSLGAG